MDKENMNKAENAAVENKTETQTPAPQSGAQTDAPKDAQTAAPQAAQAEAPKQPKGHKNGKFKDFLHAKQLRYGSLSVVMTVIVIALVMLINYVFGVAESNFAWSVDLSYNQKFSISDETKQVVQGLDQDVKIYTLLQANSTTTLSTMINEMLGRYKALGHIAVENLDIVANPTAASRFQKEGTTLDANSIIVSNADESKFKVISESDMYDREYGYDSNYQPQLTKNDFIGEQAVTSAILYVTSTDTPNVYVLQGHGEVSYDNLSTAMSALSAQNYETKQLTLSDSSVQLNAGDVILVVAPTKDLSDDEYNMLQTFLENGGRMYYSSQYGAGELKNFSALLGLYGLSVDNGLVVEDVNSTSRYYRQQLMLMPNIVLKDSDDNTLDVTKGFSSDSYVVLPQCQDIRTPEMKQSGIVYTDVLTTSDKAYVKSNITENTTIDKQDSDETGTFNIAIAMAKDNYDDAEKSTRIFVVGNAMFLANESYFTAADNNKLLLSPMEWLVNRTTSVYVPSKAMGSYTMTIQDNTTYQILTVTVIVAIPLIILLAGFIVWRRRRHL